MQLHIMKEKRQRGKLHKLHADSNKERAPAGNAISINKTKIPISTPKYTVTLERINYMNLSHRSQFNAGTGHLPVHKHTW